MYVNIVRYAVMPCMKRSGKDHETSFTYNIRDKPILWLSASPHLQGVQEKLCFCPRIFKIILRPLPRQHCWAAIGCTQNGQPIGVTVHLDLSYFPTCRGCVAVN